MLLRLTLITVFFFAQAGVAQSLWDHFFSDDFFGKEIEGMGGPSSQDVEFSWSQTEKAHILTITPKGDKETPLEIKVENGQVVVSGKVVKKETINRNGMKSQSSYLSQFTLAEAIPQGADASKSKMQQVDGSIQITFPKSAVKASSGLRDLKLPGEKI